MVPASKNISAADQGALELRRQPAGEARLETRKVRRNFTSLLQDIPFAVWVNRWTQKEERQAFRGGANRWVREGWWDYRDLPIEERAEAFRMVAGYYADGPPPLPAIHRWPSHMPLWACRMICRQGDLKLVLDTGKYYWQFGLVVIERREVRRDDGR